MPNTGRLGLHHYPTVENEKYLSGTVDLYYNHKLYYEAKETWLLTGNEDHLNEMDDHFNRVQYIIFKEDGTPRDMILIDEGLQLNWQREMGKGLDLLYVQHLWANAPSLDGAYRFANGFHVNPIGRIYWVAPDLFYWRKPRIDYPNTQGVKNINVNAICANTTPQE